MDARDDSERLVEAVRVASAEGGMPLAIVGAGSKAFLGPAAQGAMLLTGEHRGVIDYSPEELVVTARSGTSLTELHHVLDEQRQMLPFEPPSFRGQGTLGGAIASGLAGPGRPWRGGVRDAMLGVEVVNGRGERLRFGGQVMKNVAGYDLSRLMAGAFGTLGLLLSVSVRVAPCPEIELTRVFDLDRDAALQWQLQLARQPEPVTATWHQGTQLYLRLSGSLAGVTAAARRLGGADDPDEGALWAQVRDHAHETMRSSPLWRFSLPAAAPYPFDADWLTEWGGRQRWAVLGLPAQKIWSIAAELGGHATCYDAGQAFQPLDDALMAYHRRLKQALDPDRVLNRGRLYPDL
jgi:glycolate oxidase FAD binding subunit